MCSSKASPVNRFDALLKLEDDRFFLVCLILSVVPVWVAPYLPLVDIPQHAAQVATLREILEGNPTFTAAFEINWFTPYLLGYIVLFLVSLVMPIVLATKLVISMALMAFPLMTGLLLRELGADERLKWLAIPGSFSFAFYWGFFVYLVAIPVALGFLVLTVRFERNPTVRRGVGIAAFAIFLFFCHLVALGFASLIALTYLLARNLRSPRRLIACAVPYTAPVPLIVFWMIRLYDTEASVQTPVSFGTLRERLVTLFTQLAGLDGFAFLVSLVVVVTVLAVPFLMRYRFSRRPERWLPLFVGVAVYFVFPSYMQNTAFLYQRLAVFLIPLWLLAWDPPEKRSRGLGIAAIAAIGLWITVNTVRFESFARDTRGFETILQAMEPGHRAAGMPVCNASRYFSNPVYLHFVAWYQATSMGISDMSFAVTHPSMVRYRDMEKARLGERLAWAPVAFQWAADGGDRYDYFVVCAGADLSQQIFKDRAGSVELVAQDGSWWLYRNLHRPPETPSQASASVDSLH